MNKRLWGKGRGENTSQKSSEMSIRTETFVMEVKKKKRWDLGKFKNRDSRELTESSVLQSERLVITNPKMF